MVERHIAKIASIDPHSLPGVSELFRLAIMSVRDLPPNQREIWDDVFRHYVFGASEATNSHIPGNAQGVLGPFDHDKARALRARLLQRLNR
jgi:hypothetical protein